MRIRAEGPGKLRCVLEPSDPVVLTDESGQVIAGPVFWDGDVSRPEVSIEYRGPALGLFCAGILRADGVLAWQSAVHPVLLDGMVTVKLHDMMEPECPLLPEDHEWLREHRGEPVGDEELDVDAFIGRYYSPELTRGG